MPGDNVKQTPLKLKHKMNEVDSDEDDLKPSSQKKLLLDESEMEMNGKNFNIPLSQPDKSELQDRSSMLFGGDVTGGVDDSLASMDTIDAFVGPVKKEFNDLKKKIEDKDAELIELESNFYKRVSAKSVELEGIGK